MTDKEKLKFVSKFDSSFSEVFFARKAILVEGDTDKIALERAFEVKGINLNKENISILVCGSINEIPFIARILNSFKISCYVLCDSDPSKPTEPKNTEIRNIIGEKHCFIMHPDLEGAFGLERKLNKIQALKYFSKFSKFDEFPDIFKQLIEAVVDDTP